LVVTASINLADGQVCEIGNRVTLDCSGQFNGGGGKGKRRSAEGTDKFSEKIRLFPNPAKSDISIFNPFDKIVIARVYDTNGQQILSSTVAPNSTSRIGIIDYANGVYFVHFTDQVSNEYLSTEKLILVE